MNNVLHISVVSHSQAHMVKMLLQDIQQYCGDLAPHLTLTLNVPEVLPFDSASFSFPVHILENGHPMGFGANHNQAYRYGAEKYPCDYFCVINPDVRLTGDVFSKLMETLQGANTYGVIAPLVINANGEIEDSARDLPTPFTLLAKTIRLAQKSVQIKKELQFFPDWIAGMFMLFPSTVFSAVGGFDDRYFLYYEDVDICCRLRLAKYDVVVDPSIRVTHDAQRASHRDLRYLRWHLASALRFFLSPVFATSLWGKWTGTFGAVR